VPARRRGRRRLARLVAIVVSLALVDAGLNLLLRRASVQRALTARLEAAFGRPVTVDSYGLSLLSGVRLEAYDVRVAEDPRFGVEYFLRAEALTVGPRWSALLRGRLLPGTISLEQPSLNLVISEDGKWNLAEWLPRASNSGGTAGGAGRFARLEVDRGRINFKRGSDKLAFALVEATGYVEQSAADRWHLDLAAQPWRAAVLLQQAGDLRLSGTVGGLSSRFRPAALEMSWQEGSVSDLLRLLNRSDYGARGTFAGTLEAHSEGPEWKLAARAEFRRLHRWDLPMRADNPGANVIANAAWSPESGGLRLENAMVELPRSKMKLEGTLGKGWVTGQDVSLHLLSDGLQLQDLLAWMRAFRKGVAEELSLRGVARIDVALKGWPPQPIRGKIDLQNVAIEGGSLRSAVHADDLPVMVSLAGIELADSPVQLGDDGGSFQVQAQALHAADWQWSARVDGKAANAADLLDLAAAFGASLPYGWGASGPVGLSLAWEGMGLAKSAIPQGEIRSDDLKLRTPFLGKPATLAGKMELTDKGFTLTLDQTQALGARWSGSLERETLTNDWTWNLTADHVNSADMQQWLSPQKNKGLLSSLLPFLNSRDPKEEPSEERGQGKLNVGEWDVGALELSNLRGQAIWDGKQWTIEKAQAQIAGGSMQGNFRAEFGATPAYGAMAQFARVELAKLSAGSAFLRGRLSGQVSGEISLQAVGVSRSALAASLECRGTAQVEKLVVDGMDLGATQEEARLKAGRSEFRQADAKFHCGGGKLAFDPLILGGTLTASGDTDFAGALNLRLETLPAAVPAKARGGKPAKIVPLVAPAVLLTGTLVAPKAAPAPAVASNP
jgi:hypothetical protein